jgi:L-2,4-diaminobutyrate decarboxylase
LRADALRPAIGTRAEAALAGGAGGAEALRELVEIALDGMAEGVAARGGPVPAAEPTEVESMVWAALEGEPVPRHGVGAEAALRPLARLLAQGAADPADPACAAHLHTPPLAVAVAADLVASALNPSLDSWDQAPAAIELEAQVVRGLAELAGYGPEAGGVMTSGGTASNLMGLLLARDRRPPSRLRVLCSEAAHFSIPRSAGILGLGEAAVTRLPVDAGHRMEPAALRAALRAGGGVRTLVVATAGTTDAGAIDPLPEIAWACAEAGAWLHVDAAYGGGALFSDRLRPLLAGLEGADSIALDLHKLGWQPLAAGAFLVRDSALMAPLEQRVAYLSSPDDEAAGYVNTLGLSLRTSRRADAFKVAVTLRALGIAGLGRLVDRCHALARHAADAIAAEPLLQLALPPVLTTVVFRYAGGGDRDAVNAALRRGLLRSGRAVVGRTELRGPGGPEVWLKLTLLNPHARTADVDALLEAVVAAGRAGEVAN